MDPNACLDRIRDAKADGDRKEAACHRKLLLRWVDDMGNTPPCDPDWRKV